MTAGGFEYSLAKLKLTNIRIKTAPCKAKDKPTAVRSIYRYLPFTFITSASVFNPTCVNPAARKSAITSITRP